MIHSVIVTPKAKQDIFEIADDLAEQNLEILLKFLDDVQETFRRLSVLSELGTICRLRHSEMIGIRVWPVAGFPNHLVFYRLEAEHIRIVRLMHGAQDWEPLLND